MRRPNRLPTLALVLLSPAAAALPDPEYRVVELPELPGAWIARAHAINSSGTVVGECNGDLSIDGYPLATHWTSPSPPAPLGGFFTQGLGAAADLTTAGGPVVHVGGIGVSVSMATDVNDAGVVIGRADFLDAVGLSSVPFVLEAGEYTVLPSPVGLASSWASSINEHGVVAGSSVDGSGHPTATVWIDGQAIVLDTLGGLAGDAMHVTERGVVVGWAHRADGARAAAMWVPARSGYEVVELGSFGGTFATALGAEGATVVGYSDALLGARRAFVWENGVLSDLGALVSRSEAHAIDEDGAIVGGSDARAVLWRPDTRELVDLNDITQGLNGRVLVRADDVVAGRIVGYMREGTQQHAFVLERL
jgi:probable HAF family extracellular repeat protein